MPSTAECSGSPTRSSSSRPATSSCPPRIARGCSSGASSTRHRRRATRGEPRLNGLVSQVFAARRRDHERRDVHQRLPRPVRARDPRLHPHELAAAALFAHAQTDPAGPVRRLRGVSASLPAPSSRDGSDRSLADPRLHRPRRDRPLPHLGPRALPLKERPMALTTVEIRHLTPPRTTFRGYRRESTDHLLEEIAASFEDVWRERADLADKVEQLETDLVRFRELETLLRTTLVSAEQASAHTRDQARREAELIVTEAHAQAREIQRRAVAENERLSLGARRVRAQLI